jgi:transcriptional regulator with XRE-family HTH domain
MDIRLLRQAKRLSQKQLAMLLGVERSAVSKWETGQAIPRAEKFPAIAEALGCDTSVLFANLDLPVVKPGEPPP